MVFTDTGRNQMRNWLAGTTSTAPGYFLVSSDTSSVNRYSTTMSGVLTSKSFISKDTSITRQVNYECLIYSTEATGSTIGSVGLSTATTGTAGTVYSIDLINPISKDDTFDIQINKIVEIN